MGEFPLRPSDDIGCGLLMIQLSVFGRLFHTRSCPVRLQLSSALLKCIGHVYQRKLSHWFWAVLSSPSVLRTVCSVYHVSFVLPSRTGLIPQEHAVWEQTELMTSSQPRAFLLILFLCGIGDANLHCILPKLVNFVFYILKGCLSLSNCKAPVLLSIVCTWLWRYSVVQPHRYLSS